MEILNFPKIKISIANLLFCMFHLGIVSGNIHASQIGALEYLHRQGYAHADIKASNIMTDYHNDKQMYLIDYGLAHRFSVSGKRAKYTEDKKMAHNGTCLFTSRDAHKGARMSLYHYSTVIFVVSLLSIKM